jgi:hypothetical protein
MPMNMLRQRMEVWIEAQSIWAGRSWLLESIA